LLAIVPELKPLTQAMRYAKIIDRTLEKRS
jgi:hypothetical protein